MTEQAQAVAPVVLSVGAWASWLTLTLGVAALVGWSLAELFKRIAPATNWSKLKRTVIFATVAALSGLIAGAIMGWRLPYHDPWIGGLAGLAAGASPGWIVRRIKARKAPK